MAVSYDQELAVKDDMTYYAVGKLAAGVAGGDTEIDFEFNLPASIKGGRVSAWQGVFGDTVDIIVVVPDGGGGWFVVGKLAYQMPIGPGKEVVLYTDYSMTLPPGFRLRVIYHSVGASPPQVCAKAECWFAGQTFSELVVGP